MATRSRKLTGTAGALLAYFEELRFSGLEDYYGSPAAKRNGGPDDVVFTEVWGRGAERLGLTELTREQFTDLVEGRWEGRKLTGSGYRKVIDRTTGEEVTQTRVRTSMIDVVYAAPKSVMEYLLDAPEELRAEVVDAFRESVRAAFRSMEDNAMVARVVTQTPTEAGERTVRWGKRTGEPSKMQGSATKRVTAELLALPQVQFAARPTDMTIARGSPADPHLHAHVPIVAVCWVPDDMDPEVAKTYTPDEQGIRAQAAERDAVFMGEFARRLEGLGIGIDYQTDQRGRITWEVAGSNPEVRRFFSTNHERSIALRAAFETTNGRTPTDGELNALLDVTRRAKDAAAKEVDVRPAWLRWRASAERAGLRIPAANHTRIKHKSEDDRRAELWRRVFDPATGLTREDAVFRRETVRTTVARSAIGLGFTQRDLAAFERAAMATLVPVHDAKNERYSLFTTREVIEAELRIAAAAREKVLARLPSPHPRAVRDAIRDATVNLDPEQRAAVEAMCSERGWMTVQGVAGAGKTTALSAVVAAYRDTKHGRAAADQVIVLSTAAATAERTGQPLDADRAQSVDAFVMAVMKGRCTPTERTLILVDEAAMVDTARMAELVESAGDARIINIGDPKQLSPIGAGGWYVDQVERHGAVDLLTVYRQRDQEDVRAYAQVREGAAAQALDSLVQRDRVHVAEDRSTAVAAAVQLYREQRDAGMAADDVVIVMEGSNHEVDAVNRLVQRERRQSEEIPEQGYEVRETDTDRRWTLHVDDSVIFLEKYYRHSDEHPPPPGERRQRRVDNGESGVIVDVDAERQLAVVAMDRGDVITVDLKEENRRQPLGLRYGLHVAKYQGGEAPVVIVLPSASPIASQNSGYTQLTRAQVEAHVVVDYQTHGDDPVAGLAAAWSRPVGKQSAISQLDPGVVAQVARDAAERRPRRQHAGPEREEAERRAAEREPTRAAEREPAAHGRAGRDAEEEEAEELLIDRVDLEAQRRPTQAQRAEPEPKPERKPVERTGRESVDEVLARLRQERRNAPEREPPRRDPPDRGLGR